MRENIEHNRVIDPVLKVSHDLFGRRIGLMGKIFGCWHKHLSRPFTNQKNSYRVCLDCGAMKRFDVENLKTVGPFYYPAAITLEK